MKQPLAYLALLTLSIACQDDTKQLLNNIDGRWSIHSVTYRHTTGRDSILSVTNTQTFLIFDQCASAINSNSPASCRVDYSTDGQLYGFSYQAPNGNKSLYISPLNSPYDPVYKRIADQLSGSYEVVAINENTLI